MRLPLLLAVLLGALDLSLSARILAVFPFPGKSHFIFISSVIKTLTQKGHRVVEYSPFPPNKPTPNYSHIKIDSNFEELMKNMTYKDFMKLAGGSTNMFGFVGLFFIMYGICEETFKNDKIQQLLMSNEKFDLIITESPFGQESMVVFGEKFKAPVISIQTFGPVSILNMNAGNALSIAHITDKQCESTDQMSFPERVKNFISVSSKLSFYYLYHLAKHDQLIRKYFSEDVPPLKEMINNISLYLVNDHPNIGYVQPYTPNIIPIAGINISPERSPLPQDIQKFMDEAKGGVVYFSLGSVVPTHTMPKEILQVFINVFSKLKQKVLWKIEAESLLGLSKNVKLVKWVPQPGVLAHPNCVLFMTHGGLLSQQEALHAGVPTVGIPIFADQPFNIKFSEQQGFGVKLDLNTISEETVTSALNTVLNNSRYREKAQKLSRIFRDRPVSPADSVIFWVEYVLRHGGAHHLRPASTRLSWYQLALLDVLATILLSAIILLVLLYLLVRKLFSSTRGKKKVEPKTKKTN